MSQAISSVLFACDYNAVRSPMAEGLMKKFFGQSIYVQSVGVKHDFEIDGYAIAVCAEIGVELTKHRVRNFSEMEEWGDAIGGFDLIVPLSEASQKKVLEYTRLHSFAVDNWQIMDPTSKGRTRDEKMQSYRETRDQIISKIEAKFGPINP